MKQRRPRTQRRLMLPVTTRVLRDTVSYQQCPSRTSYATTAATAAVLSRRSIERRGDIEEKASGLEGAAVRSGSRSQWSIGRGRGRRLRDRCPCRGIPRYGVGHSTLNGGCYGLP